jgi:hypothetical protein
MTKRLIKSMFARPATRRAASGISAREAEDHNTDLKHLPSEMALSRRDSERMLESANKEPSGRLQVAIDKYNSRHR